jgi:hypothetical protein
MVNSEGRVTTGITTGLRYLNLEFRN